MSLGKFHGERATDGIKVRISQEELASFLGVSRQVVNQYLQEWKGRGWVELGRGAVTVRDEKALAGLVQGG